MARTGDLPKVPLPSEMKPDPNFCLCIDPATSCVLKGLSSTEKGLEIKARRTFW